MSITWRRRCADLCTFCVVAFIGVAFCDGWLHLAREGMFFGGSITALLARAAGEIAADIAG